MMVKSHNVKVTINNKSGFDMIYKGQWYGSGRVADGFDWSNIKKSETAVILNYESDWSLAGCSGYVQYEISGTLITIAFSNPVIGYNKLNVGDSTGSKVWDDMEDHDYRTFVEQIKIKDRDQILYFNCKCSGGITNDATIVIFSAT